MKKKETKLLVVKERSAKEQQQWIAEHERWDRAEKKWRTGRRELRQRVKILRDELESYLTQMDAVPFDIPNEEVPHCLDWGERKNHIDLAEDLFAYSSIMKCSTSTPNCSTSSRNARAPAIKLGCLPARSLLVRRRKRLIALNAVCCTPRTWTGGPANS